MGIDWDRRFLHMSEVIASWSKDPSTKVGSLIVDSKKRIKGLGYNGFPRGVGDNIERYQDRAKKYAMVVHAETNAVLNATSSVEGCTCYVTHPCCSNCAAMLIQAGIRKVVWYNPSEDFMTRFADSISITCQMFNEVGVRHLTLLKEP